jgi:hypothetical protein
MENKLIIHSNSPPIFCLRGMNVMLDADLAKLYGVSTTRMNEQVKRNKIRFPDRFCFQMTPNELKNWISQNATSKSQRMGIRKCPWVFTEYGVAMVSSVLNSTLAVEVSIQIIQSFIEIKRASSAGEILIARVANMERIMNNQSDQILELYSLMEGHNLPKSGIFFNDEIFDAYVFSSEIIASAKNSIVLIDNYIDETTLLQLSKRKTKVDCTIYTEKITEQLKLDIAKHNAQYPPIEIKILKAVHDRFLILDNQSLYHLGASLKDLGKRWFAFSKMDGIIADVMKRLP